MFTLKQAISNQCSAFQLSKRLCSVAGDTENRPAGQMLEASGKSGLVGLTTSKSTLGLGNRSGSRGLKPHNETVSLAVPRCWLLVWQLWQPP